jgi:hypothetical protein
MRKCTQRTITPAALTHLRGIHALDTDRCAPAVVAAAAALLARRAA